MGRLSAEKGVLELVAATVGMRLVVAGDGPLRERVPGALGFVPHHELAPLYARAAVVACPSRREGFGVACAEAMAHGRPVVASAVGGLLDLVVDGETGLLVPPGDADALRAGLERVLDDAQLRRRLGEAGRARARERFSWERGTDRDARRPTRTRLPAEQPAVVLGLLWAGLSFARSMGRLGVEVSGISMHPHEFGVRCRYLRDVHRVDGDAAVLAALREESRGDRPMLLPERDDHVEFVLRHWDDVRDLYRLPMPENPEVTRRLRRKETLPEEAAARRCPVPADGHRPTPSETLRALDLRPPFLLKPVEGQHFAGSFGAEGDRVALTLGGARGGWREAKAARVRHGRPGADPEAHEKIWSLFAYIGRSGRPLATVTGVKVRQGPIRFGTSAVFQNELRSRACASWALKLLETSGYQGFGHVEFAHDHRDDEFKLLEVNTRVPMWAGVAMSRYFDMARIAYDDLLRRSRSRSPSASRVSSRGASSPRTSPSSLAMARRRELGPAGCARPYLHRHKVRAVMAKDDPLPALRSCRTRRRSS